MHYYQHHIGDFIKDTANLDDHQLATYLRMVWAYYSEESPLSNDVSDVAFAMRSDEKTVGLILRHYFKASDDGWHHGRCDREIAEFHSKKEKASTSANARWKNSKGKANAKQTQSGRNANASKKHANASKTDANQEPRTNNQEPDEIPPNPLEGEEPAKPSQKFDPIQACPENVTPEVWADWVKFRKELRKPLTETSCERQAKELAGHSSPDQVILASISAGWQGLFPDRISNVTPIRGGKPTRPALKPGEFYDFDWDDKNPSTHKIYHSDTHDPTTGYAWAWLKKQTWYRP